MNISMGSFNEVRRAHRKGRPKAAPSTSAEMCSPDCAQSLLAVRRNMEEVVEVEDDFTNGPPDQTRNIPKSGTTAIANR